MRPVCQECLNSATSRYSEPADVQGSPFADKALVLLMLNHHKNELTMQARSSLAEGE